MGDGVAKAALYEEFARLGKALANGKRLELIDLLAQGERSVEALAVTAGLGMTTASAHLQTLRQSGLVTTRREGTKIFYRLAGPDVLQLFALLRGVAQERVPTVQPRRVAYLRLDGPREAEEALTQAELLAYRDRMTVIDVRPEEEFRAGHVPGAVSVPLEQLEQRLQELSGDTDVVAYCRGEYCVLAYEALEILRAHGLRARRLQDGMLEWRLAGLEVERGSAA